MKLVSGTVKFKGQQNSFSFQSNTTIYYMEIKMPTRCNILVSLLQKLLLTQHVSGTIMPIIRSSRVIQMVAACGT